MPLLSGLMTGVAVSCGIGCRRGSDPALLQLWRRPVAAAPIRRLAWEPPCAAGAALEMAKRQKTKQNKTKEWTSMKVLIGTFIVAINKIVFIDLVVLILLFLNC